MSTQPTGIETQMFRIVNKFTGGALYADNIDMGMCLIDPKAPRQLWQLLPVESKENYYYVRNLYKKTVLYCRRDAPGHHNVFVTNKLTSAEDQWWKIQHKDGAFYFENVAHKWFLFANADNWGAREHHGEGTHEDEWWQLQPVRAWAFTELIPGIRETDEERTFQVTLEEFENLNFEMKVVIPVHEGDFVYPRGARVAELVGV